MTATPLKVFTVRTYLGGNAKRQVHAVVAASTKAAAIRTFGVTAHEMRMYGSETGNALQVEVAMSEPGAVFFAPGALAEAILTEQARGRTVAREYALWHIGDLGWADSILAAYHRPDETLDRLNSFRARYDLDPIEIKEAVTVSDQIACTTTKETNTR